MTILARLRIERAVQSYDLWLDLQGAPGRRRRELRRELRANLTDAAATLGARTAVRNLGSIRAMALGALPQDPARARWSVGAVAGVGASALVAVAVLLSGLAWIEGATAVDPRASVSGGLPWFPGSELAYAPVGSGIAVELGLGWAPLAAFALTFVLVAQPWRSLRPRRTAGA